MKLLITRFPRRKHFGFTLIESTAVVAITAVLMSVAVSVILLLDKQDARIGLNYLQSQGIVRLTDRFRTDVHRATTVRGAEEGEPPSLIVVCISPTADQVEYHLKDGYFFREEKLASDEERQDRFMLTAQTTAHLNLPQQKTAETDSSHAEPAGQLVELTLSWPALGNQADKKRSLKVIAQQGKSLPVQLQSAGGDHAPSE